MATLTIRDLDEALKHSLRVRAASRNRSMEEEARQILRAALAEAPASGLGLGSRIRSRFASLGDVQLVVPVREAVRTPPNFAAPGKPATKPKRLAPKPRRA
jgi:antitoxin FitA